MCVCVFVAVMEISDVNMFQMKGDFVSACQIGVGIVRTKRNTTVTKCHPNRINKSKKRKGRRKGLVSIICYIPDTDFHSMQPREL